MSQIISLQDLRPNTSGIYKINYPNGKYYIGLSVNIKRRMYEHNDFNKAKMPCDLAIKKYGKITEIEILELCPEDKLGEREIYWIKYYDATNPLKGYNLTEGGDGSNRSDDRNPRAVFTNDQVLDIRKRRFYGEAKKKVYQDYLAYSHSSFEHIWLGRGYPNVGQEYLIPVNSISRQEYSSKANMGVKNGRAKLNEDQIRDIRARYDNGERLKDIHALYDFVGYSTIFRVAHRQVYQDIK